MPITGRVCEENIYSQDYVDLIVDYNANSDYFNREFENVCVQYVNGLQAVVYEPYDTDRFLVARRGYRALPKCYGLLDMQALQETGILRLRRQPFFDLLGQGVIVAVIDNGIDFRHPAFVQADGISKIIAAWNQQDRSGTPPEGIAYGTEYTREQINEALRNETRGNESTDNETIENENSTGNVSLLAADSEHGTAIAAAAAGREVEEADFSGAAPLAELVVVKLKEAKQLYRDYYGIADNIPAYQENDILLAISYVLSVVRRERKPVVFCLGIGTNQGDHNGTGLLSEYLNLITVNPGIYVCAAAGNETGRAHHFRSRPLMFEEIEDVEINVESGVSGFTAELWGGAATLFAVAVKPPIGEYTGIIEARFDEKRTFNFILNNTILEVSSEIIEESTGDELMFFRFINPAPGIWTIRVFQRSSQPGVFDMWLPMENFVGDRVVFLAPDPDITVCEPANTSGVITFAGCTVSGDRLYVNSSRGFTRNGRVKPDITAPAVGVYTAAGFGGFGEVTGTSMAAGLGAGAVALIAEWGRRNIAINNTTAKNYLIRGADREGLVVPDKSWGWGRLDIYSSFVSIGE